MTASAPTTDGELSQATEGTGLTLLRLGLWTGEMQLKIKMMVEVVEDAKSKLADTMPSPAELIFSQLW